MATTQADIRVQARIVARNASDQTYYTNAEIDEAASRLLSRFQRVTRCVKATCAGTITASTNVATFSALTGFLVDRIERVRVVVDSNYTKVCEDLDITNAADVMDRVSECPTTGTPRMIGFTSSTDALMFPAAKYNGTITGTYAPLFSPFQLGQIGAWSSSVNYQFGDIVSSGGHLYQAIIPSLNVAVGTASTWTDLGVGTITAPSGVTTSIPDALITEVIGTGIAPMLQAVDPEHQAFVGAAWASYLAFEAGCLAIGSISGKSLQRERCDWR